MRRGNPLPEGYQWQGNQVRHKARFVEKNYAPIQINVEGKIDYRAVERLSNPNTMRNNFKADVETRLRGAGLTGENSRTVVEAVKDRVEKIKKTLPKGVELETFYDRTELINRAIATVEKNLVESIVAGKEAGNTKLRRL